MRERVLHMWYGYMRPRPAPGAVMEDTTDGVTAAGVREICSGGGGPLHPTFRGEIKVWLKNPETMFCISRR